MSRKRLAWRRRVIHTAVIVRMLLRVAAIGCALGVLGAVGGMELGGGIREGMKLVFMWAAVGGFCLLTSEVIDRVVNL